jgi:hypothetical protein
METISVYIKHGETYQDFLTWLFQNVFFVF